LLHDIFIDKIILGKKE